MSLPMIGVVMAGGSGERFWPISRRLRPKQLLYLTNDKKMMIEEAVDRLLPLIPRDNILIATNDLLREPIKKALPEHADENILGEPMRRNTVGCLAYVTAHVLARYGEEEDVLMSVTPADHQIGNEERFRATLAASMHFAEEKNALVTIGVHPTRPETGYGYVEITDLNQPLTEREGVPIYKVKRFLEKPNWEDAERYQASRFYYWNSGMFFWRVSQFMKGLEKALPEAAQCIRAMTEIVRTDPENEETIREHFAKLPNISIDYGLMEKSDTVYVALSDFRWDDVGAWDALTRIRQRDERRNTCVGEPVLIDCKDVIAYNEPGAKNMAVCVIGMRDVVVVTSADGVLVCPKNRAQDVRKAVEMLKKRNADQV